MAKAVYVCMRRDGSGGPIVRTHQAMGARLAPDNITVQEPRVIQDGRIAAVIFSPVPPVVVDGSSVCLGFLTAGCDRWREPMTGSPEGAFAVFRSDERYVEAITDVVASRTVWYYVDDEMFAASVYRARCTG